MVFLLIWYQIFCLLSTIKYYKKLSHMMKYCACWLWSLSQYDIKYQANIGSSFSSGCGSLGKSQIWDFFGIYYLCVLCTALWSKGWHFWRGCYGQNGSQNIRYDIYFYDFCNKHPLMKKRDSKVWKKYCPNISPHFLDAKYLDYD